MPSKLALKHRLTVFTLVALLGFVASILWWGAHLVFEFTRAEKDRLETRVVSVLSGWAIEVLTTPDGQEGGEARAVLSPVGSDLEILLVDTSDKPVAGTGILSSGEPPGASANAGLTHWRSQPIRIGGQPAGTLWVGFRDREFYTVWKRLGSVGLALMASLALFVFLTAMVVRTVMSRRLIVLNEAAERVSSGDLDVQVELRGNDEIAQLGRRLARMVYHLSRNVKALSESEQRFEFAVNGSNDGIWDWNVENDRIYLSPRFSEILEYADDSPPGLFTAWFKLIHPDDQARVRGELFEQIKAGGRFQSEFRMQTRSGRWRWILARGQAVRNERGKTVRMAGSCTDITGRKEASLHLEETLSRLRVLIEALPDFVFFKDGSGAWNVVNSTGLRLFDLESEPWFGRTDLQLAEFYPDRADMLRQSHRNDQRAWETRTLVDTQEHLRSPQGEDLIFHVTRVPLFGEGQARRWLVVIGRDVTERYRAEEALSREKERAQVTLQSIGDGVITTDVNGNVEYLNPIAERLTGWRNGEARGQPLPDIFMLRDELSRAPLMNPVETALRAGEIVELTDSTVLATSQGEEAYVDVSAAPIRASHGEIIGSVLVFHDITERRNLMQQLSHQATHDALTGLINRYEFERRLRRALVKEDAEPGVLAFLDLDQFKIVNDTCGHSAGDELLRQVSDLLRMHIRKTDTLARLGGDEFGLLLEGISLDRAVPLAESLREAVAAYRYASDERLFSVRASIGLVEIHSHGKDVASVLSAADEACYIAKEKGRDRVHVLQAGDEDLARLRGDMQWATRLRKAFDESRFVLYAQPIARVGPKTDDKEHYEILLRMKDEMGIIVRPGAFLPAAERYGLVTSIDRWVIQNAIEALATAWPDTRNMPIDTFSINLCGATLGEDGFLDFIKDLLEEHGVPTHVLCFEITETVAIANFSRAMHFIHVLKDLGCRFSLDDFGSGFSSFSYLKTLPVDYLKIDGSFVMHMSTNSRDAAMVKAINQIGHIMGLETIAEFVGNRQTLDQLATIGVDYAQGEFLGMPVPLYDICYRAADR